MAERLLLCLFSDLEMDGAVFLFCFVEAAGWRIGSCYAYFQICSKFLVFMCISLMTRWLRYEESGASFF